jgi:hypothetical protein
MVFRPPAAAGSESSLLSSAHTIHSLLSVLHRPSVLERDKFARIIGCLVWLREVGLTDISHSRIERFHKPSCVEVCLAKKEKKKKKEKR